MRATSLWIIRVALAIQFAGVLAVPAVYAADEQPRAMWMAEWLRQETPERAIGVLRIRDGKVTFTEQLGQVDWEFDLASIKRVVASSKSLTIVLASGKEYAVSVMEANLTPASPKKVAATLEHALQSIAATGR